MFGSVQLKATTIDERGGTARSTGAGLLELLLKSHTATVFEFFPPVLVTIEPDFTKVGGKGRSSI